MYHSIKYYRGGVLVSIRFTKVNETNIDDIRKISVKENQTAFIETVDECLKEAEEYAGWCPVGIYNDDILVGFAMYGAFGKILMHGLTVLSLIEIIRVWGMVELQWRSL